MPEGDDRFWKWWAINHPADWWAQELGKPLPHMVRLLVAEIAREAFRAGECVGSSTSTEPTNERSQS